MANPPGASPDEPASLERALAVSDGQLLGSRPKYPLPAVNPAEEQRRELTRVARLPAELVPSPSFGCNAMRPEVPAGCPGTGAGTALPPPAGGEVDVSVYRATYQPYPYFLPGMAARLGSDADEASRLARVPGALVSLALVFGAIWLLWVPGVGGISLLGLLVALTPMALFCWSTTVSGSGPEIAGGICATAAVLRLARGGPLPRGFWALAAAAIVALTTSRPLGPLFLVLAVAFPVALLGVSAVRRRIAEGGRTAMAALLVMALAGAASVGWQVAVDTGSPTHFDQVGTFITHDVFPSYQELFGVFGWIDTDMNLLAYAILAALAGALLVIGFQLATARQRRLLLVLLVVPVGVGVFASAFIEPGLGRVQGRWLLPVAVAAPLLAGEALLRNRERLAALLPSWTLPAAALLVAAVQAQAWLVNAHRHAVGVNGPRNFLADPAWSPPLGWGPWLALAIAGAAGIAAFGYAAARDRGAPA
jgi:Predicted membrane protein (DUF2142)